MKFISISLFFIIGFLLLTSAFSTVEINAPTDFIYQEVLTVNVSAAMNVSGFPFLIRLCTNASAECNNVTRHVINVTILNHSGSSTDAYGILASSLPLTVNVTNDTSAPAMFWNFSASFTNGRQFIKVNFTNVSRDSTGSFGGALTSERIVQIDVAGNVINLGGFDKINISLTEGHINTSGGFMGKFLDLLTNVPESSETCAASNRGLIIYNSTDGFMGCTESGWYSLNSTN